MILKNMNLRGFADSVIREKKKIVLFGAGTLLTSWIPYVLSTYGLSEEVLGIVDNDQEKWGKRITLPGCRDFQVLSPEFLECGRSDFVILITSSYFANIVEQLDCLTALDNTECYIAPVMFLSQEKRCEEEIAGQMYLQKQEIPKIIHYCWFGQKEMPEKNRKCIESWRKFCPDYEIREWNESNYDVSKNLYMKQAYEAKKYGYVPDYARLDLLCEYGGLYFDTDVELIRGIDDLLFQKAFISFEEYPTINAGGGSGAVKGFPLFRKLREFRERECFLNQDGSYNLKTCGYYETVPLVGEGLRLDGSMQNIRGLTVFPSDYFHPKSSMTGRIEVTKHTYGIHHFNWSWVSRGQMDDKLRTQEQYDAILNRMREHGERRVGYCGK